MKSTFLFIFFSLLATIIYSQDTSKHEQALYTLIAQYAQAREAKDTVLLKQILTEDIDQLVSSGEWRTGMREAVTGMLQSSENQPGTRVLTVEKIRFLNSESAVVDARYEIHNTDGSVRKMWSTFIAVYEEGSWKITAIRNMRPTGQ